MNQYSHVVENRLLVLYIRYTLSSLYSFIANLGPLVRLALTMDFSGSLQDYCNSYYATEAYCVVLSDGDYTPLIASLSTSRYFQALLYFGLVSSSPKAGIRISLQLAKLS